MARPLYLALLLALAAGCASPTAAPSSAPAAPLGAGPPAAPAAASPAAPTAGAAPGLTPLRTTVEVQRATMSVTGAQWPDFVAQTKGLYAAENLKVENSLLDVRGTINALMGGSVEVSFTSPTDLALAVDKGANVVAVGSGIDRAPYALMAVPQVKTFADLRGKRVGAAAPTEAYTSVIKEILRRNGLDPERDVELVFGGSSNQRVAALQSGGLDATLVLPPQDQELVDRGYSVLASTLDYYPNLQLSITAARRDWAQENGDVLRAFLRAQAAASKWLNNPANKDEAAQILAEATKSSLASALYTYEQFVTRAHAYPDDGCIQRSGMENLLALLRETGQIEDASTNLDTLMDRQWCPS